MINYIVKKSLISSQQFELIWLRKSHLLRESHFG